MQSADALARQGIDVRLLAMHTIKPLDADVVRQAAEETGAIVTAEDHSIIGSLGSAVAEALAGRALYLLSSSVSPVLSLRPARIPRH